jgi:hypothetical protein
MSIGCRLRKTGHDNSCNYKPTYPRFILPNKLTR